MVKKPWRETPTRKKTSHYSPVKAGRNGMIAKIHIAKKDLRLDDDTYRSVLFNVIGKDSCSKMNMIELEKLIKAFVNDYGWKAQIKNRAEHNHKTSLKRPFKPRSTNAQIRFFYRLFFMLGEYGVIENPSSEDANKWCRKYFNMPAEWLSPADLNKACERLKAWGSRVAVKQENQAMLEDFNGIK